jgi:Ser/Thr protein kinase RdoA (MazF antagonist)
MNPSRNQNHIVPVQRSIVSADALASVVAEAYGLDGVRCQLIKSAMLDTYQVMAASGPAILRIYPARRRTEAEILAELDVLAYLHMAGLSVSIPIRQRSGEQLLTVQAPEGPRCAALFTYAPGRPLSQQCTPPHARAYGQALAQVHTIADTMPRLPLRPRLDLVTLLDQPLTDLAIAFAQRDADWAVLRQIADAIGPQIAALPTEPPYCGLCHGDAASANAHVTDEGHLTLFDFDMCGAGWRAYDIATFLIDEPEAIAAAFLEGYAAVRAVTDAELASLPLFQIVQSIWVLGLRADYINDWGSASLSERLLNHILSFISRTMERVSL